MMTPDATAEIDPELADRIQALADFVDGFDKQADAATALGVLPSTLSKALSPKHATRGRLDAIEGAVARWKLGKLPSRDPVQLPANGALGGFDPESVPPSRYSNLQEASSTVVYELTDGSRVVTRVRVVVDVDPNARRHDISQRLETAASHPQQP